MYPKAIALLLGGLFLSALVAACTSPASPTATEVKPTATSAGPTVAPSGPPTPTVAKGQAVTLPTEERFPNPPPVPPWPPKKGGWVRIAQAEPANLDGVSSGFNRILQMGIYDRLVVARTTLYDPESYFVPKYYGELAERWENPDPKTFIFYVRKGVKYQNVPPVNGREFTAEDVKWNIERYMAGGLAKHHVELVDSVEVLDKYTVKVNLKRAYPNFPFKMGTGGNPLNMMPRELVEAGEAKDNSVGTGAFLLKNRNRGVSFTLARNPDYWLKDKAGTQLPYLDGIHALIMTDQATALAAFRTKQIDVFEPPNITVVDDLLKTNPDIRVLRAPPRMAWSHQGIMFRLDKAPWNDARVRRAVSMAIDRQAVIDAAAFGDAVPGYPIPWELGEHPEWPPKPKEWLPEWWSYNPAKAKQLMAEAGYPNGLKVPIIYSESPAFRREPGLLIVADQLKANIGLELQLQKMEAAPFNSQLIGGTFDQLVYGNRSSAGGYEWEDWVYYAFHSKAPGIPKYDHLADLKDQKLDDMLDRAWETANEAERKTLHREIFDYLANQTYYVGVAGFPWYSVTQPYLQNWASNAYAWAPYIGADQVRTTWLEDDALGRKQSY